MYPAIAREATPELSSVMDEETLKSRFLRGNVCSCLLHSSGEPVESDTGGGRIVSYCWIAFNEEWIGEIEMKVRPRREEAYLYDAFTLPQYRCRNLFSALLSNSLEYLRSRGYSRALIFALSSNKPSIRAIEKSGFKCFQSVLFFKLLGRRLHLPRRRVGGKKPVDLLS